jgi:hypothetical protein
MQYFSIIARKEGDVPRTCAMLQSATIEAAAAQARRIVTSNMLPHVDKSSRFSVRRSSRRETTLLQEFLASGTGDKMTTYLQEEIDSLLWRRNGMLLSFFMALYLDPKALKKRFSSSVSGAAPASTTDGSGSGGVTQNPIETSGIQDKSPEESQQGEAGIPVQPTEGDEGGISALPDASSQIDVLEDIVNGSDAAPESSDDELDLFE